MEPGPKLAAANEYNLYTPTILTKQLKDYYLTLDRFFADPKTPHIVLEETRKAADIIADCVPEYQLIIGSGYPHYALDVDRPRYSRV